MTSRLLITGKNNALPDNAAQTSTWPYRWCATCEGDGYVFTYAIDPSAKPRKEICPECHGDRVFDAQPVSRAQSSHSLRETAARLSPPGRRAAPIYDLTRGRWIRPPSGTSPDAVAAAEQRLLPANNTRLSVPTLINPAPGGAQTAAGRVLGALLEALVVVAWLAVGWLITSFFMVIS